MPQRKIVKLISPDIMKRNIGCPQLRIKMKRQLFVTRCKYALALSVWHLSNLHRICVFKTLSSVPVHLIARHKVKQVYDLQQELCLRPVHIII